MNKIATIQIGKYFLEAKDNVDIYYYPENITEYELANELKHLKKFYGKILFPRAWPAHIRPEKVMKWINGL